MDDRRRVALITGGGTGIGAAIARRLAGEGDAVAIVGRRAGPLEAVVAEIAGAGGTALAIPADLADAGAPASIVDRTTKAFGGLDVLVNNAAVIRNLPIDEMPIDVFDEHLAVNIRAPFLLIRAALPWLKRSPAPAVVNISSSSGSLAIPGQATYGLTKAAIEYMTRSYAAELAPFGIRVNCIAPGPVDTPIHLSWAKDMASAYVALRGATPLAMIGDPDDIARWVAHLADPRERFVTGAVFAIDAGQTLNGWSSAIAGAAGDAEG